MPRFNIAVSKEDARSVLQRATSSRIVMVYLAFSLFYCVIQTALSARAFIDNSGPDDFLSEIAALGDARNFSIPLFKGDQLALCASESSQSGYRCNVVWDGVPRNNTVVSSSIEPRGGQFNILPGQNTPVSLTLGGLSMELDKSCLFSLNYAIYELDHSKRENVAFLSFQIWVFIMSTIAVLGESIPHILASLLTHVLVLIWGIFDIIQTVGFREDYQRVITDGACSGANFLPDFFSIRNRTQIASLAVNFIALIVSCFLTMRLVKILNWRNFKSIGANRKMSRHRKVMLVLFICIQLSLFFTVIFATLLFDSLIKGNLRASASFPAVYKVASLLVILGALPWILSGWYAVQYELRLPMFFFLVWAIIYLAGFGTMFFSTSFLQEFLHWPFMATVGVMSEILTGVALVFGLACRYNFGKGYLEAKEVTSITPVPTKAKDWDVESSPHEEEHKIEFPSTATSDIPQFTFEPPMPPPRSYGFANGRQGPSFLASSNGLASHTTSTTTSSSESHSPPAYRDSATSFGNFGSLSSSGHGARQGWPGPSPTASFSTAGKLGRMFTSASSRGEKSLRSSAEGGTQETWSSWGNASGGAAGTQETKSS